MVSYIASVGESVCHGSSPQPSFLLFFLYNLPSPPLLTLLPLLHSSPLFHLLVPLIYKGYESVSINPEDFEGKVVLILGRGLSVFLSV